MGKAEDVFMVRKEAELNDFKARRAAIYRELRPLVAGFAELAEKAGYPDMEVVYRTGSDIRVGWSFSKHDYETKTGFFSYIEASTGTLTVGAPYCNMNHFNDPAFDDTVMYSESPTDYDEALQALRIVTSRLRSLRQRLEQACNDTSGLRFSAR